MRNTRTDTRTDTAGLTTRRCQSCNGESPTWRRSCGECHNHGTVTIAPPGFWERPAVRALLTPAACSTPAAGPLAVAG